MNLILNQSVSSDNTITDNNNNVDINKIPFIKK